MNAAGRRRRHRENVIAAIASVNRLTLDGLVLREIRFGDKPTVLLHLFGNLVGNRPFVERIRAVLRDQLQTFRQVLLHQLIALLQRFAVFPEDSLAVFVIRNHFAAIGFKIVSQGVIHHKTFAGELNRRLYHFVERQGAIFFQRQGEACDGARRTGGEMRGQGFFAVRVALIVKEHIAGSLSGGHLTEVDGGGFAVFGPQHHKAAAAQVPRLRMRHRQRIAHRDCRIHRITALPENIDAHFRCQRIHRRHHTLRCPHGMKNIFLHAVRNWRSRWRVGRHAKCAACHQRGDRYPAQKRWFHHYCSPGEEGHIPRLSLVHNS